MIMRACKIRFIIISLFLPLYTLAAPISTPMSANHLYAACNESIASNYAKGFCDGAISASYESIEVWCVPANVTHGEVKLQVKKELLASYPLPLISASYFVKRSVQNKWPCQ